MKTEKEAEKSRLLSGRVAGGCFALLLVSAIIIFLTNHIARATSTEPPSKMSIDVAIRLDRDLAHIREADNACRQIRDAARNYDNDAVEILAANKIDQTLFNKGEIKINFTTGEITRPSGQKEKP